MCLGAGSPSFATNRKGGTREALCYWRDGVQGKYDFLRSLGWREVQESKKVRWLQVVISENKP